MHTRPLLNASKVSLLGLLYPIGEIHLHWSDSSSPAVTLLRLGRNGNEIRIKLAAQILFESLGRKQLSPILFKVVVMRMLSWSENSFKYI